MHFGKWLAVAAWLAVAGCGGAATPTGGGGSSSSSGAGTSSKGAGGGSGSSSSSSSGSNGSNSGSSSSGGGASATALCNQTCANLMSCGAHPSAAFCSTDCEAGSAAFLACVQTAGTDCNSIATCIIAALCGTGPSGSDSCATTADCEGTCNTTDPTLACGCACVHAMDPSLAFDLLVNNECTDGCASCTAGPGFNGAACNACAYACTSTDACAAN